VDLRGLSGQDSRNTKLGAAKLQGCDMEGADFSTMAAKQQYRLDGLNKLNGLSKWSGLN